MQSFKTIGTKLYEELRSQEIPSVYIIRVKNDYVHNVEKVTKIDPTIMSNPHAHPHTMRKTHAVSKQWVQNCMRSCAHKIPMLNVDGWTDGRTNERTETCTPMSSC